MILSTIDYNIINEIKKLHLSGNKITRRFIAQKLSITEYNAQRHINLYLYKKDNDIIQKTNENTVLQDIEQSYKNGIIDFNTMVSKIKNIDSNNIPSQQKLIPNYTPTGNHDFVTNSSKYRFLILPDIHAPFDSEYALQYIANYIKNLKIDVIICTGDECDYHASSFHDTHTSAMGVEDELYYAKTRLRKWTDTLLPLVTHKKIYCVDSNHGAIPDRKRKNAMISKEFIKSKSEVLELPEWEFLDYLITDKFGVSHGTAGGTAMKRALLRNLSWIIGHNHSKAYVQYVTQNIWAAQVSCVMDKDTYGAAYSTLNQELSPILNNFMLIINNDPFLVSIK